MPSETANNRPVGGAVQHCPLQDCGVVVQVIRQDTGAPLGGVTVDISGPTPGSKPSAQDSGMVEFKPVKPGAYTIEAKLAGALKEDFQYASRRATGTVPIGAELVRVVSFVPLSKLSVRVFCTEREDGQPGEVAIANARVSIRGPSEDSKTTAQGTGLADFGKVQPARYNVRVQLSEDDQSVYQPPDAQWVEVAPGESLQVPMQLQRRTDTAKLGLSVEAEETPDLALEVEDEPMPDLALEVAEEDPLEFALHVDEPLRDEGLAATENETPETVVT